MPWTLFGGVQLIDDNVDRDALFQAVGEYLDRFAKERSICETIITLSPSQTVSDGQSWLDLGYELHDQRFTHLIQLQPDYEQVWRRYKKPVRKAIRKANKNEVIVSETRLPRELEAFTKSTSRRNRDSVERRNRWH